MNEFSDHLRAAAAAHSRRIEGSAPPQTLRASIAKARRLRTGGATGIAVVALAAIGAAGVGFTGMDEAPEPSPSASVDLSIDEGEVAYTTIAFPEESPSYFPARAKELCGQPLPEESASHRDFEVYFDGPADLTLGGFSAETNSAEDRTKAHITYTGAGILPAFVEDPLALILRDGVVVGTAWPMGGDSLQHTFNPGGTLTRPWEWFGGTMSCEGGDDLEPLEAGEYEIAFVLDIHNDEQAAATFSLLMHDLVLPPRSEAPAFREGSYECGDHVMWDMAIPITCRPRALPGIEIDEEAGTVTVPYDTKYFSRNVDLRFVTSAFPVTLEETTSWFDVRDSDLPSYERGSVPVCGDNYASVHSGRLTGTWTAESPTLTEVGAGDTLKADMWLHAEGWASAEFAVPERPRLWITRARDMQFESPGEDGVTFSYSVYEIVGWIDASVASEDTVVEVVRYDGPSPLTLSVDAIQWCDGVDPQEPDPVLGSVHGMSMIASETTVTFDNGIAEEIDALVFYN